MFSQNPTTTTFDDCRFMLTNPCFNGVDSMADILVVATSVCTLNDINTVLCVTGTVKREREILQGHVVGKKVIHAYTRGACYTRAIITVYHIKICIVRSRGESADVVHG